MDRSFAATWDYRCPFARNAHEAIVNGLRAGADWEVEFHAFSLDQAHVEEGDPPVWNLPADERGSGVLPLQWGIVVRDRFPDQFFDFHIATFGARFDEGLKIGNEDVLREVAAKVGLEPDLVAKEIDDGWPLETLAREHQAGVDRWAVFGVPTLIVGDEAAFVRIMERGNVDDFERVLDLMEWTRLNEFKRTKIPR
ncbi:MAG: DsbA family protein [Actinobacteria bacterium]|nr:DsbA family protein [Actinomycetota bacterium]